MLTEQKQLFKKTNVGIVSGYFNPLHRGHLVYINAAKQISDFLFVIVNNDKQVKLKGSEEFLNESERLYIILNIRSVDDAMLSIDRKTKGVQETLEYLRMVFPSEMYDLNFFNSGDRSQDTWPQQEIDLCKKLDIKPIYLKFDKINSSSEILRKVKHDNN